MKDIVKAIEACLQGKGETGKSYSILGRDSLNMKELIDVISKYAETTDFTHQIRIKYLDFFEKLVIGRTHDKNMVSHRNKQKDEND